MLNQIIRRTLPFKSAMSVVLQPQDGGYKSLAVCGWIQLAHSVLKSNCKVALQILLHISSVGCRLHVSSFHIISPYLLSTSPSNFSTPQRAQPHRHLRSLALALLQSKNHRSCVPGIKRCETYPINWKSKCNPRPSTYWTSNTFSIFWDCYL